ncbi:hypothetical protein PYW07_003848 [Mythimna separata]|uniref:Uncharacterized protein n=1 Tax=Mythimna separata TaxID=271217 RepID=A0AAD8DTN7_MYTSE|nr:hypothetical protein PYW07_003848 [Mythimna separata]
MIKFWKSAAKGKTGCPVRPPEARSVSTPDIKSLINAQILLEENEDPKQMFEKSSKLSLSLHDIIVEKKALKYFIQYMESIGKDALIKYCSSEFSISTQNTLLAMGDPVFRKKKRNLSVPDMTIDSNQLYNADALWQRNRSDGLNLGRVNSLGRFESKFEPDPDKKDKSVLKKMVSRFVPMNASKVEEEMAWQIAHMIVKDVTDLTMAPPENEHDDM